MSKIAFPSLKLNQWPPQDRALWLASLRPAGILDDGGLAANWRPPTQAKAEKGFGIYLRWLASTGQLDPDVHPCERITKKRIEAFYDAYRIGRAENTIAGALRDIAYVLRACAPPDGVAWLTRLAHRLANSAKPSRPKLPRMAPAIDILNLGERLMTLGLEQVTAGQLAGAPLYRDGLMTALLIQRPIRLRNLAGLRIDETFILDGDRMHLRFAAEQTKKGRPIDITIPAALNPAIDRYLAQIRPLFLRQPLQDDRWLWLGRRGKPLAPSNISSRLTMFAKSHLGRAVSPHLYRDCVATEIALHDPAHIGITKSVLDHATLATSQKYYNQATSLTALAKHAAVIQMLRDDSDDGNDDWGDRKMCNIE